MVFSRHHCYLMSAHCAITLQTTKNVHGLKKTFRCVPFTIMLKQFHQVRSKPNMPNCFPLGNSAVSNAPYLAKWKCCSNYVFFSLSFQLKYTLCYLRTSNFRADPERSYILLWFEAENVLEMLLNVPRAQYFNKSKLRE